MVDPVQHHGQQQHLSLCVCLSAAVALPRPLSQLHTEDVEVSSGSAHGIWVSWASFSDGGDVNDGDVKRVKSIGQMD